MKTVIITTGGFGTRLLTYSKVMPKAMVPLFDINPGNKKNPIVRPLIEMVFDNLFDQGFRRFCFIVGAKTRDAISNHLKPEMEIINLLNKRNFDVDRKYRHHLEKLYEKINSCEVRYITQETPMGFGHALLTAKKFVKNETFLLHAGDVYIPDYSFLKKFIKNHSRIKNVSGTLLLQTRERQELPGYGIAKVKKNSERTVIDVEEKPKRPASNLVILPMYIFNPRIFFALEDTSRGHNNELQLTDGIKTLIQNNEKIISFNFKNRIWFDVGTSNNYYRAFNYSYKKAIRN